MFSRWQQPLLEMAIKTRRVLILSGPRQCGKTTLAKTLISEHVIYRTLDDKSLLEAARNDPNNFVKFQGKTLIIDEVQHAPMLLSAIKIAVDEENRPGQFLLTGSANIQSLPAVNESLAGRISKIRLRPLSQGEILRIPTPLFLKKAFEGILEKPTLTKNREELLLLALQGGFPETLGLETRERQRWHRDYFDALLERDLKDIINIRRQHAMKELVRVLAAWSSKFIDLSAIGAGLSIQRATLESYINALEALYLIDRVHPWTKTDYERVGKQDKLFFADCGAMASLLFWHADDLQLDGDRLGKLLETYAYNQLAAHIDTGLGEYVLYHYRDREKREIDFIIERADGALLGIEVKASSSVQNDDFKHMRWFKTHLAKEKKFTGILLYTGEQLLSFGEGLYAAPFSTLFF
jgi:predicted AAA+ superfamily ATPase